MRTKHTIRNVIIGLSSQVLLVVIGFVSRKLFIDILGNELLGINGLYTSIISMLSLTDLGIGTAIICNLYKPLADRDEQKVTSLVQFYAKAYRVIALTVLVLGLAVTPFLNLLLKENMDPVFLSIVFILFLSDTVITYFFAHKRSLIFADQRNYIVTMVTTASMALINIVQIIILLVTRNYILFLSIKVVIRIAENSAISRIADKQYPFIKQAKKIPLEKETKSNIISNTKALALHYLGIYLINGTDNIIISKFLGVIIVGLYSNYYLILTTLKTFLSQFSSGIMASFGNMVAKETSEKSYDVFKKAFFINFIIYNFVAISLLCLFNPFITLWINVDSLLPLPVVIVLSLNFYITGIAEVSGAIRASAGVFRPDKYLHLALAALNLAVAIALVQVIGIIGVFLGTLVCLLIKEATILPRIVYKHILKAPFRNYYRTLIPCLLTTLVSAAITLFICNYMIDGGGILNFLLRCTVCFVVPNVLILILYRKTDQFKYLCQLLKEMLGKLKRKSGTVL